jgi:hypothetical protein
MKKQHEKRTKRDNTAWGDDDFDSRKKKGLKPIGNSKRIRPQDLHYDDDY